MNNADIVTFVTKSFNCKNCPGGLAPLAPNPLSFLHVIRYDLLFSSTGQVFSHEIVIYLDVDIRFKVILMALLNMLIKMSMILEEL